MLKKGLLASLLLSTALFLTSCDAIVGGILEEVIGSDELDLDELIEQLNEAQDAAEDESSDDTADIDNEEDQLSEPEQPIEQPAAESQSVAEEDSSSGEQESEPQPADVELKEWVRNIVDGNNGVVKNYYDGGGAEVSAEIWMGGIPTVYYIFNNSDGSYFQLVDTSGNLNEVWDSASSHNSSGMPNYNLFPDNYSVDFMFHRADDLIQELFVDVPDEIAYSNDPQVLNDFLGVDVKAEYEAPYSDMNFSRPERWVYEYEIDGYTILMMCYDSENLINNAVIFPTDSPPVYDTY